jgi:hypothetical protein
MGEILLEAGAIDAALRRGWVRIRYLRLDGVPRIMLATTNPRNYTYIRKTARRLPTNRNIRVWEYHVGWRSLRRNRIQGWEEAGPIDSA